MDVSPTQRWLFVAVPPAFAMGPLRLHVPQVGAGLPHPLTVSVSTPLLMTLLSCDWPVQPVSRSAALPSASNESDVGHEPPPGVGVVVGPPPPGVDVAVGPPPPGVGVPVGATGVEVFVAVGGGLPLHSLGYGFSPRAPSGSRQSALNSVTQSTQSTMSCAVLIESPHDAPPGIVTFGQLLANPICAGVRSSPPPQSLSAPPHALQIAARFFDSAFAIAGAAFTPSGHGPETVPFRMPSSHFWSAFDLDAKNLAVDLPIER